MIKQITKKEYARKTEATQRRFHLTSLFFTLPDGTAYQCDTTGPAGLKEIHRFQSAWRKRQKDQTSLLELKSMVQS